MKQSIAAIMLMLACGVSAGAGIDSSIEVYRWKDGSGVVNYSDTPPTSIKFTRVRLGSSMTTTADGLVPRSAGAEKATTAERFMDNAAVGGVDTAGGTSRAGPVDPKPAEDPLQDASASAQSNCTEARQQLQYVEGLATEKPADDPQRASSPERENAYQSGLTAYSRYQTARDAQLLRVGRLCAE